MPDEGTGLTGVQVEAEPEGGEERTQLTHHKIHLKHTQESRVTYKLLDFHSTQFRIYISKIILSSTTCENDSR